MADRTRAETEQLMEQGTRLLAEIIVRRLTGCVAERDDNVEFVLNHLMQFRRERIYFRDRVAKSLSLGDTGSVVIAAEKLQARVEALEKALREIKLRVSGLETVGPVDAIRRLRQIANLLDGEAARKLLEGK